MKTDNDINETFSESIKKIEKELNLPRWGFEMIALRLYPKYMPRAIFQSKKCIVDFHWNQERSYTEPFISTTYARVHAPLDDMFMIWNGQRHHCWHSDYWLLIFLDGLTPHQITSQGYPSPSILRDFHKNNEESYIGELTAKMTLLKWNHYGDRFFNLLDLQHPELWEKYSCFLKEFYEHRDEITKQKGLQPVNFDPQLYMVC
ncbi:MAG TPA: hypothetical protein PLT08_18545 [Anaerolineales bacterium]|nr:hypothetical protein [Anaerolineales bacterium]